MDACLASALRQGDAALARLHHCRPRNEGDAVRTLLRIHDLHLVGTDQLRGVERWQHHPAVAALKWELEQRFIARLDASDAAQEWQLPVDPVAAIRSIAALDRIPRAYSWVARHATVEGLVRFLALEGGPDGGFDDLVAICQVGLRGGPKLALARNYWDEMGRGDPSGVHSTLHDALVASLELPTIPRHSQPAAALDRAALGSLLATNRWLQPEMLGALGLIELQAGPRSRQVVAGMERLGLPVEARTFYEEHATADPRHGKDWLDHVTAPLSSDPEMGRRMVRGARWRWTLNARFLEAAMEQLGVDRPAGDRVRTGSTVPASSAVVRPDAPPVAA